MVGRRDVFELTGKLLEMGADQWTVGLLLERLGRDWDEEKVYKILLDIDKEVAENFYKTVRLSVWCSDNRVRRFDRERIVESLVEETGIPRSLAERIAKEVEDRIKERESTLISASAIRELVLSKLSELGLERERMLYSRLGIPVYDLRVLLSKGTVPDDVVLRSVYVSFATNFLLPSSLRDAIFSGFVDIRGLKRFFVPYTRALIPSSLPDVVTFLLSRSFADTPTVSVDPLDDTEKELVVKLGERGLLLPWSSESCGGCVISQDIPYAFGGRSDRGIVLEYAVINVDKIVDEKKSWRQFSEYVHTLLGQYTKYLDAKKKYSGKTGESFILLSGLGRATEGLFGEVGRGEVEDVVSLFYGHRVLTDSSHLLRDFPDLFSNL